MNFRSRCILPNNYYVPQVCLQSCMLRWEESFMAPLHNAVSRLTSWGFSAEINSEEWPLGSLWVTPAAAIVKMQNCLLPKCKWEERVPYNNNQLVRHRTPVLNVWTMHVNGFLTVSEALAVQVNKIKVWKDPKLLFTHIIIIFWN